MKLNSLASVLFILSGAHLIAQQGDKSGTLIDAGNGGPIPFANVLVLDVNMVPQPMTPDFMK